jgi:hypothetical protein
MVLANYFMIMGINCKDNCIMDTELKEFINGKVVQYTKGNIKMAKEME